MHHFYFTSANLTLKERWNPVTSVTLFCTIFFLLWIWGVGWFVRFLEDVRRQWFAVYRFALLWNKLKKSFPRGTQAMTRRWLVGSLRRFKREPCVIQTQGKTRSVIASVTKTKITKTAKVLGDNSYTRTIWTSDPINNPVYLGLKGTLSAAHKQLAQLQQAKEATFIKLT